MIKALAINKPFGLTETKKVSKVQRTQKQKQTSTVLVLEQRKKTSTNSSSFRLLNVLAVILTIAVGGLGVSYLFGINTFAAKGYELSKAQQNLESLNLELRQLNLQAAERSSLVQVQGKLAGSGLVPVTEREYLHNLELSQR